MIAIGIILIIVPVILYVVTGTLIVKGKNKLQNSAECIGIIKGIYENTSALMVGNKGHKAVSPVISYTVNGMDYEFIGNYYSTSMKIGQKVKVLYRRDDFSKATIKTGIYVAPLITGALAVAFTLPILLFLCACAPLIPSIKTEEFQKYLENTYGADRGFTIISENNAHWGEYNVGTVCFTADDLNGKEFVVYGRFDPEGNPFFDDDYMEVKYADRLREYYASYFDSFLKDTDCVFCEADVDEPYDDGYSFPIVSFEEYLKLVGERKVGIILKHAVALNPDSPYFVYKAVGEEITDAERKEAYEGMERYISDNFNTVQMEKEIADIIKTENLTNIWQVDFRIEDAEDEAYYYYGCNKDMILYEK